MTGDKESTANTPNNNVDRSEKASDELAIVFSVWPAWIAKNDGGATPKTEKKAISAVSSHFGNFENKKVIWQFCQLSYQKFRLKFA